MRETELADDNIKVKPSVKKALCKLKTIPREPYNDVVERLLKEAGHKL